MISSFIVDNRGEAGSCLRRSSPPSWLRYPLGLCLLPMSLAFHCTMLNVLSDVVDVWAGLGGGKGARDCVAVLQAVHIQPLTL